MWGKPATVKKKPRLYRIGGKYVVELNLISWLWSPNVAFQVVCGSPFLEEWPDVTLSDITC